MAAGQILQRDSSLIKVAVMIVTLLKSHRWFVFGASQPDTKSGDEKANEL